MESSGDLMIENIEVDIWTGMEKETITETVSEETKTVETKTDWHDFIISTEGKEYPFS